MDLNRVKEFYQPTSLAAVPKWQDGFAWLAGGTWLFSEPQPSVRALIDLDTLAWPALQVLPGRPGDRFDLQDCRTRSVSRPVRMESGFVDPRVLSRAAGLV